MTNVASDSGLAEALARVGDRWTLLLVDALLEGPKRFNDLAGAVPGIAPNILSGRLKQLERDGIVLARPYSKRPVRLSYELSAAGRELAGAMRLLAQWGSRRAPGRDAAARHPACGGLMEVHWYCPTCARVVEENEISELRIL